MNPINKLQPTATLNELLEDVARASIAIGIVNKSGCLLDNRFRIIKNEEESCPPEELIKKIQAIFDQITPHFHELSTKRLGTIYTDLLPNIHSFIAHNFSTARQEKYNQKLARPILTLISPAYRKIAHAIHTPIEELKKDEIHSIVQICFRLILEATWLNNLIRSNIALREIANIKSFLKTKGFFRSEEVENIFQTPDELHSEIYSIEVFAALYLSKRAFFLITKQSHKKLCTKDLATIQDAYRMLNEFERKTPVLDCIVSNLLLSLLTAELIHTCTELEKIRWRNCIDCKVLHTFEGNQGNIFHQNFKEDLDPLYLFTYSRRDSCKNSTTTLNKAFGMISSEDSLIPHLTSRGKKLQKYSSQLMQAYSKNLNQYKKSYERDLWSSISNIRSMISSYENLTSEEIGKDLESFYLLFQEQLDVSLTPIPNLDKTFAHLDAYLIEFKNMIIKNRSTNNIYDAHLDGETALNMSLSKFTLYFSVIKDLYSQLEALVKAHSKTFENSIRDQKDFFKYISCDITSLLSEEEFSQLVNPTENDLFPLYKESLGNAKLDDSDEMILQMKKLSLTHKRQDVSETIAKRSLTLENDEQSVRVIRSDYLPSSLLQSKRKVNHQANKSKGRIKHTGTQRLNTSENIQEPDQLALHESNVLGIVQPLQSTTNSQAGSMQSNRLEPLGITVVELEPKIEFHPSPFTYKPRVARWFDEINPCYTDPKYTCQTDLTPEDKEIICIRHNFGLALDPIILEYGIETDFVKENGRKDFPDILLSLPGEIDYTFHKNPIIRKKGIRKYIFTICIARNTHSRAIETKSAYHRWATFKPNSELIKEFASTGQFAVDFPELGESLSGELELKQIHRSDVTIENDGSYIESRSKYIVVINDPKNQVKLRAITIPNHLKQRAYGLS